MCLIGVENGRGETYMHTDNISKDLEKVLRPDTSLVSIMLVNNEIGVRQPIEEIGLYIKCIHPFIL